MISDDDMREAWLATWRKYRGKKMKDCDIWLKHKALDPVFWVMNGNRIVDQCNNWLDEMSDRWGDD